VQRSPTIASQQAQPQSIDDLIDRIEADAESSGGVLSIRQANFWRGFTSALSESGRLDRIGFASLLARIAAISAPDVSLAEPADAHDDGASGDDDARSGGALVPLRALGQRLAEMIEPHAVLDAIAQTLSDAVGASYVAIYLRAQYGAEDELVAELSPGEHQMLQSIYEFPFMRHDEVIGNMLVGTPESAGPLSLQVRAAIEDFARRAGGAMASVRLMHDLKRAREQMVFSREEERKLLRRNLHDTIGPTLASLHLQSNAVRKLVASDPARAMSLLDEMRTQIRSVIGDIRRVVENLRPPALDELGLLSAIEEQAKGFAVEGLDVYVDSPGRLPPLNAAVEVAAYRIVLEALANVVRHAHAKQCWVRIKHEPDLLRVEVLDDGSGLPASYKPGVGLASMRQRALELGGECRIQSAPEAGMLVTALLPLMPAPSVTVRT
jgi:signal transduction histidine kinase